MQNKTDQELIELIKNRDEKAIQFIRKEYLPMIRYLVLNYKYLKGNRVISGTQSDVDDVLQDALYIIIKKIFSESLTLSTKLSTYFYAICKNLLKLKLNKRLFEMNYIESNDYMIEHEEEVGELFDDNLKNNVFDYYVLKLSTVCQEILNLYWLNYSVEEISDKLGNTKKYIMKRKYECQKKLIKMIQEHTKQ